jgi:peptide chain release factor 3
MSDVTSGSALSTAQGVLQKEILKRRTFAIISHPDAGKTTMTEKLLLYGGAIQLAGSVKAKRGKKFATSDWMELEKQRGISVTSSVMKFPYEGHEINLIDTPGHQDFSEDTYRTLTAVDSALMLIDGANGVEAQTKKLFEVCSMRKTPVMAFINKMDRESRDPFDLIDEIEKVLGIACYPVTWPIGMGQRFRGVYDRQRGQLLLFEKDAERSRPVALTELGLYSPEVDAELGPDVASELRDQVEILSAGETFDRERYLRGELAPVFFGSALNNFGVQTLLDALVEIAPPPIERPASQRPVKPLESKFTAFVFKIQANMDPSHRDRVAFMRIVSGKFERGMKAWHVRLKRETRLGRPTQFMAQDRSLVDEAYAGDIVGVHDPGIFKIGDTLSEGEELIYTGIPVFSPEHFVRVQLKDPLKSKQLNKALDQLSEEGAVQVLRPVTSNDQYLGVVGALQFDVVKYRIEFEYGVKVQFYPLPYTAARWIRSTDPIAIENILKDQAHIMTRDQHDDPVILLDQIWRLKLLNERHPKITFATTSENLQDRITSPSS